MNTAEDLKKEFGRFPKLADVAKVFLGIEDQTTANRLAGTGKLPFPAFRMGSERSPWIVDVKYLAEYIDKKSIEAKQMR
jgi:hypothetical protein